MTVGGTRFNPMEVLKVGGLKVALVIVGLLVFVLKMFSFLGLNVKTNKQTSKQQKNL